MDTGLLIIISTVISGVGCLVGMAWLNRSGS